MIANNGQFDAKELAVVLSHYDIGPIVGTKPLPNGNGRVPKIVVTSTEGRFILKRRSGAENGMTRRVFVHAVQKHLANEEFAVPQLIGTRDESETILQVNGDVYELFEFVAGGRYDGSRQETFDAGRQLANLHRDLVDFEWDYKPVRGCFHDSKSVRNRLKTAGSQAAGHADEQLRQQTQTLMCLYNEASVRVNMRGFDAWAVQVVHGDWHPGNILFRDGRLAAVLDFDSTRLAPPITDVANGMLQFSLVAGQPNPADWPAHLDERRLTTFLAGYQRIFEPPYDQLRAIPDLMIEALIAEAIAPVAKTGSFEDSSGRDFLNMIQHKIQWILDHRSQLEQATGLRNTT